MIQTKVISQLLPFHSFYLLPCIPNYIKNPFDLPHVHPFSIFSFSLMPTISYSEEKKQTKSTNKKTLDYALPLASQNGFPSYHNQNLKPNSFKQKLKNLYYALQKKMQALFQAWLDRKFQYLCFHLSHKPVSHMTVNDYWSYRSPVLNHHDLGKTICISVFKIPTQVNHMYGL